MKMKPRDLMGARLASGMGVGLIALSLSGLALAEPEKPATPAPKPPTAEPKNTPPTKAPTATLKKASPPTAAPTRAAAPSTPKDAAKTGVKAAGSKATQEDAASAEGDDAEKKPPEPSRKEKEAIGAARVKREVALHRYAAAKAALAESEDEIGPKSEVDQVEARAARKAALAELKSARKSLHAAHRHDSKRFVGMKSDEKKEIQAKLKAHMAELRKTRKERSEEVRTGLEKRFGKKLELKSMQEELVTHGWRVARLNQIIEVATVTGRPEEAERAKELLKKEDAASKKRLAKLSLAPLPPPPAEAAKKPAMAKETPKTTKSPASQPAAPKGAAQ